MPKDSGDPTTRRRKMNQWKRSQNSRVSDKAVGTLDVSTEWLKVIEWNETQIIATDDSSICLTSQTIFDLKRKTVIALDVRKPEAQGFRGACNLIPDRQTYYLQDVADYYARKFAAR